MATSTVVCPECGAAAAPGRFACPACGALVASLGSAPKAVRPAARRSSRRPARDATAGDPGDDELIGSPDSGIAAAQEFEESAPSVAAVDSVVLELDNEPFDALEPDSDPTATAP